jgi:hypothetical protein
MIIGISKPSAIKWWTIWSLNLNSKNTTHVSEVGTCILVDKHLPATRKLSQQKAARLMKVMLALRKAKFFTLVAAPPQ